MDRLLTASRVTIDSTIVQNVCLDSLLALVVTTTSIPCMFNVDQGTATDLGPMRRLRSDFKGKLNCTFDMVAALNQSNPTQTFIMDCKENPGPYDYSWLWGNLGFFGGQLVVWCLRDLIVWIIKEFILLGLYVVLARGQEI